MIQRASLPSVESQLSALRDIFKEYVAHLTVDILIIYQQVTFEIILETAEIKICGTCSHKHVVYYHCLCMEHTGLIQIHLDAGFQALRYIGE